MRNSLKSFRVKVINNEFQHHLILIIFRRHVFGNHEIRFMRVSSFPRTMNCWLRR